jgi:ABC-type transport system substrate-binding protein
VGPYYESLRNPAKRLEHQLAQSGWRLEYLGDNARQTIVPQYDGRPPTDNFSEYNNPAVNRLIDRALAELDRDRRAAMWGQIDQRIMRDAPLVSLIWENFSFQWASRVHGWVYDPSAVGPDLTAPWLDPPQPLTTPSAQGGPGRRGDRGQQVSGACLQRATWVALRLDRPAARSCPPPS